MTTRRVTSALFALLVAFLLVVQGADAAKPGSTAPTTLVTTDAYEATELFDTADLLAAINADLGGGTLDEVALLGGSNGLAYGAGGVLVLEFEALDSSDLTTFADGTQDLSEVVSGVALYADDGTLTASVHTSTYWAAGAANLDYADAFPDQIRGARLQGVAVAPATAGGLQLDDLIALQWAYDEGDARGELQVVRIDLAAGTSTVLYDWAANTFGARGQIGVDGSGRIVVGSDGFADASGAVLRRIEQVAGTWQSEDITPSIGIQNLAPVTVASDGTVYTVAPDFGTYDGEIWALDPATDSWSWFADFDQRCCTREFRTMTVDADGDLFAALGSPRQAGDYIAGVASGASVAWGDRFAETTSFGVRALTGGGAAGELFCVHDERDSDNPSVVSRTAIYCLKPATDSGGGGGGGGGGGNGKGKNK